MIRRLPVIPTMVVAIAVAIMIGLGVWQLQRAQWKDRLVARYAQAQNLRPIAWPSAPLRESELPLFRHATAMCMRPLGRRTAAGTNRSGEPGYVHIIDCATGGAGGRMSVEVGWSKNPNARPAWDGGPVSGIVAPDRVSGMRLVAAGAPPGLEPSAPPSIAAIANNHRSYAIQWFSFAAIALIIYGLALRTRLRKEQPKR